MPKDGKKIDNSSLSLDDQLIAKHKELIEAKKNLAAGTLQNPHVIKDIRREIARILTKIQQEKLNVKEGK